MADRDRPVPGPEYPVGTGAGMAREREPRSPEASERTSDILKNILESAQEIIRSEVRLARAELREEASKAIKAVTSMALGAVVTLYGIGFVLAAVVWAIALGLAAWASALIVGGVLVIAGAIMISAGRKKMKQVNPTPERTVQSLKEDAAWLRNQTK
jgi:uncharacterized membrane protein YqjE